MPPIAYSLSNSIGIHCFISQSLFASETVLFICIFVSLMMLSYECELGSSMPPSSQWLCRLSLLSLGAVWFYRIFQKFRVVWENLTKCSATLSVKLSSYSVII